MSSFVESRTRVRYKETDQMGIAHHSNYLVWFEIGRTDLCRAAAVPYSTIEARGLILVVVEIGCTYRRPFHYDDEVLIRTSLRNAASRSIDFGYELMPGDGAGVICASGFSRHIWVDKTSRRPVQADAATMRAFAPFLAE